jgi:hypothetical protein
MSIARVGVMASIFMALRQICRSEGEGMEARFPLGGRAVAWACVMDTLNGEEG